jgi:hypothetical protein
MSDIDFDELDRAVNGALEGAPVSEPAPEGVVETSAPTESPSIEHVERTVLSPIDSPKPATSSPAPAARRSSGRFMDMVHPSSDMRGSTGPGPFETKPPVAPVQPAPATEAKAEGVTAWSEPLESPFLPDAKVEKRPLGGGEAPAETNTPTGAFDFQGLLDDEPKEELLEAPEPQELLEPAVMPDPIDFAAAKVAIPEEIESKPLEIEVPTEETAETPAEKPEVVPEPSEPPKPVVTEEEPVGPTSITQQYKEQPSSTQESGAIFDTESYHQPVVQPTKKKSGWLTVMWIVILVALGAAAGWAVFNYVLPTIH